MTKINDRAGQINASFIAAAETIRIQRKRAFEDQLWHSKQKKQPNPFSQQAIWAEYPTYKRLLEQRAKNQVAEHVVRGIASLLECPTHERNHLLRSAGYAEDPDILSGAALDAQIAQYQNLLDILVYPAFLVNQVWDLLAINQPMVHVFQQFLGLRFENIPEQHRNILHFMFDPVNYSARKLLNKGGLQWDRVARSYVYSFQQANRTCQFESWYQEKITSLMQLPDFERIWQSIDPTIKAHDMLSQIQTDNLVYGLRTIYISESDSYTYPRIHAYVDATGTKPEHG
ncbi:MmyB family transcriptional regulator [Herpetosiphon geysericola]|uniref:MmyB-like transcription regulator ligand binding domain-containing protein n=1 Tax=Herpetosiphon geysericola TaxID=70996 RepID=A0A0P6YDZ7_9CHLR|nr:hypothetical protein [Herpetosiphon geysericola]KPL90320.1 hypothetical protein SE18_06800 [Herpetosiphon geysericola]